MTTRLQTLRTFLKNYGLSHLLISDPVDVTYLSGFSSTNAALLIGRRSNRILTDFRYTTAVRHHCTTHPEWKFSITKSCMAEAIASFVTPESHVGFQSDHYTVDEYKKLRKKTPGVRYTSISRQVKDLLMVKTPDEIAAMEQAAAIGDSALKKLLENIHPGLTELALARQLEQLCTTLGSEKPSFDTIVLFGENAALPHGRPGSRTLKKGDFILIDFGCTIGGFASDMTRTVFCGKATARQRSLYTLVRDAQQNACSHAKAGMRASEIDALARSVIDAGGFAKEFGHALGHGVGRRIHEAPRVSSHTKECLPENCVITIEPGIYISGFGGIRIEDMVVLHQGGARLLTHSSKELIEV